MRKRKLLIITIGVLLIFSLNLFQPQVRGFFYSFSAPIQKKLWAASDNLSGFLKGIFRKDDLIAENKKLVLNNQELLKKLTSLEILQEENRILREALEIGLVEDFSLVFADVIGKDAIHDSILISKGFADGLSKGMGVITEQRVLLGKIDEVYNNFARVTLISDKKSSFDAEILGRDAECLVVGHGGEKINLDRILRDKAVQEGDIVVSSSLGGVYPKGLLVGSITTVQKDDVKSFQQAEVSLFFRTRELRNVFVILK